MKKVFFLMVLIICTVAVNAATYRIKYDVNNQRATSFVMTLSSDKVAIGQRTHSLRRMGTITNSGLVFDSYCYGYNGGMLCVATASISVKKDIFTTLSGYIVIIDSKAYLADKIN